MLSDFIQGAAVSPACGLLTPTFVTSKVVEDQVVEDAPSLLPL